MKLGTCTKKRNCGTPIFEGGIAHGLKHSDLVFTTPPYPGGNLVKLDTKKYHSVDVHAGPKFMKELWSFDLIFFF
jgi:hypothetical protein